jgi:hypothetical protein
MRMWSEWDKCITYTTILPIIGERKRERTKGYKKRSKRDLKNKAWSNGRNQTDSKNRPTKVV